MTAALEKRIEILVEACRDLQDALGDAMLDLPVEKVAELITKHEAARSQFLHLVTWSGAERGGWCPGEREGWATARPDCAWGLSVIESLGDSDAAEWLAVAGIDFIA